jgi:transposase-like protein
MARHRRFSLEFKRQVVLDILEKRLGLRELSRKHNLSRNLLSQWVRKYETGQLTDEIADAHRIDEYEGKIAELERKVGQFDDGNRSAEKRGAAGTPAERRQLLHRERPEGFSAARGCRTMKLARSTYYYRARRAAAREMALHERIINLCEEFPRYG